MSHDNESWSDFQVRQAHLGDVHFIDSLQKSNSHEVGFLSRYALGEYVTRYNVTIGTANGDPVCYLLGRAGTVRHPLDARIYQACVRYDARFHAFGRALVDCFVAALTPSVQHLALWCAQDIEANLFWEANAFSPLAYRLGKKQKGRVHLLWVRGLHCGTTAKSFEVPLTTTAGQMRKTRIVVPIPQGQSWKDVKASDDPDVLAADWENLGDDAFVSVTTAVRKPLTARREAPPEPSFSTHVQVLHAGKPTWVPRSRFVGTMIG